MKVAAIVLNATALLCMKTEGFSILPTRPSIATTGMNRGSDVYQLYAWSPFKKEVAPVAETIDIQDDAPGPLDAKNAIAGITWTSLLIFAFTRPDSASTDTELLNTLISQPFPRPEGLNEIFFAVWNCFTIVPAFLAALTAPSGQNQRLPAAPFLWGSAFLGYFALGPYFATRTERSDPLRISDLGWPSQNIFENRAFGIFLTLVTLSIPFSSGLFAADFDFTAQAANFGQMLSESRFVAVSTIDITIMSILGSVLVSEDCKRRGWEDKSILFLFGSLLLPVLGPSLYLSVRPSLEE